MRPRLLLSAVALLGATAPLGAQDAPPKSSLTGVTLPAGSSLDKGMFTRMAAKASMDMSAKDAGQSITDDYEVFKLPKAWGAAAVDSMIAALKGEGWTVMFEPPGKHTPDEKWGWMTKGENPSAKYLVYLIPDRKQSNVYFAKAGGVIVAKVKPAVPTPTPTTVPGAPAGTPTNVRPANTPPPAPNAPPQSAPPATPPASNAPISVPTRWAYTNTTFSDGWQSFDEPDWVRGVKGSVTARVHHATFDMTRFVNQDGEQFVWGKLIAPRYRDLQNVWVRKPWWEDGDKSYVSAEGTEVASGKRYYIVLFRNGNGARWVEYLAPDKATFEREMGITVQVQGGTNWGALINEGLNKFAVSAADLPGYWGSSSGAAVGYVSAITGQSLGMAAVSSDYRFTFRNDGTYQMRYVGASGMAGMQKFGSEDWAGRVIMNDEWKLSLTGAFKGATYEHDVWFEALGGGQRVLVLRRNGTDTRVVRNSQ